MRLKTFLTKFLYASSTIKDVIIYDKFGHRVDLHTASLEGDIRWNLLNPAVEHFSIKGDRIFVYCK